MVWPDWPWLWCGLRLVAGFAGLVVSLHAGVTPEETALWEKWKSDEGTGPARQEISKFLEEHPSSSTARFLLGRYCRLTGQPVLALRLWTETLESPSFRAGSLVEPALRGLHAAILLEQADCLGEMDLLDRQQEILSQYVQLGYERDRKESEPGETFDATWRRFRSLCKQGALDEAGRVLGSRAADATASDVDVEVEFLKQRAFLEFVRQPGARTAYDSYLLALKMWQDVRSGEKPDPDLWGLLAFHARRQGEFADAYARQQDILPFPARKSIRSSSKTLAAWSLSDLRWSEARAYLTASWRENLMKFAHVREPLEKDLRLNVAQYYILRGDVARPRSLTEGLLEKPPRKGLGTGSLAFWEAGAALTRAQSLRLYLDSLSEVSSAVPWSDCIRIVGARLRIQWELEECRAKFRSSILEQMGAKTPVRDFLGLASAPEWLWVEAIRLLGPNDAEKLVSAYPAQGAFGQRMQPWMKTLLAHAKGEWESVIQLAPTALAALPLENEGALRMEVKLALANALSRSGRPSEAFPIYVEVLSRAPGLYRAMDVPLPLVEMRGAGASGFADSPRFHKTPAGFIIEVRMAGQEVSCRVLDSSGGPVESIEPFRIPQPSLKTPAALLSALHEAIFSGPGPMSREEQCAIEGKAVAAP